LRFRRLGLPGIDAALSSMPGVSLEPEFRGAVQLASGPSEIDFAAFWIAHVSADAGGTSLDGAAQALRRAVEVRSVERIAILPVESVPNDSLWSAAYYFYQASRRDIHAEEAWNVTRGDPDIGVGIL